MQDGRTAPKKIKITVQFNGNPYRMEIDTGSSYSIIARNTLTALGLKPFPKLKLFGARLTDFQGNRVPIAGISKVDVSFKGHNARLPIVVAEGN